MVLQSGQRKAQPISHFGSSTAHTVPVMSNGWQERDVERREGKKEEVGVTYEGHVANSAIVYSSIFPCSPLAWLAIKYMICSW